MKQTAFLGCFLTTKIGLLTISWLTGEHFVFNCPI